VSYFVRYKTFKGHAQKMQRIKCGVTYNDRQIMHEITGTDYNNAMAYFINNYSIIADRVDALLQQNTNKKSREYVVINVIVPINQWI